MYSLQEVFTDLGPTLSPWPLDQASPWGRAELGLVAEIVFELVPGSNHSNQTSYRALPLYFHNKRGYL
jgi:hypothetical protein